MDIAQLITQATLVEASTSVILTIVVFMILTGKLVPERFYTRQSEIIDKWKEAHDQEVKLRIQLMEAMEKLTIQGEVQEKLSKAITENIPVLEEENKEDKGQGGA